MTARFISCAACGQSVEDGALFCPHCGEAIQYGAPDVDPFIGRVVSQRYTVVEKLAHGGMGEVYMARHAELNQRVAVKFLHRRFADDEEFATRFFNEARSACRVSHPNAVTIYDFGRLDDGTLYIVMEYVEGISLKEMIHRDERVRLDASLRIGQQAAEVLSAAHGQAIVHRDVKPDNIMVLESPSGRVSIKMLDFGIAKILDEESAAASLTQTGVTFGTPEYMSPEQAAGRDVDARSDVYSLGVVLFSMLVGHPPFQGKNKLALLQRHIREAPPMLDRACGSPLPAELVRLVSEMLEKDPAARPQSMDIVATRLEELQRGGGGRAVGVATLAHDQSSFAHRLLTHGSGSGALQAGGGYELGDDDALSGSGALESGAYSLELPPVAADGDWSLGGEGDYAFDDDPYAAPLAGSASTRATSSSGRAVVLAVVAVLALAAVAVALRTLTRPPDGPVESGELVEAGAVEGSGGAGEDAVFAEGSGIEDGSGTAVVAAAEGSGAEPPAPATDPPRDEVGERVVQTLSAIEAGRMEEAEAILAALAAEGAGEFQAVVNAGNRLEAVKGLMRRIDRDLRADECDRADESVIALRDTYSRALALTYYGDLSRCREERAAERAAAGAPTAEVDPPPRRSESSRSSDGVRPPREL